MDAWMDRPITLPKTTGWTKKLHPFCCKFCK